VRNDQKRAANIIRAAESAISKMRDPAKRDAADAKLRLAQKAMLERHPTAMPKTTRAQPSRHYDLDVDR